MTTLLISDALWAIIAPLLPPEPPKPKGGRPRSITDRAALTGIVFVLKSGIPWEMLPQELGCGSGMTCWRRLRDWQRADVWRRLHRALLQRLQDAGRIDWTRASLDSASVPAPGGERTGKDPTNRGKLGTKRHVVVDRTGLPLAITISAANLHDSQALEEAVDAISPLRLPGRRRGRPRKRSVNCTPIRDTIIRAVGRHCVSGTSSRALLGVGSSRVNDWGGTGGWWSERSRGSIAFDGSKCAMSAAQTSMRRSCRLDAPSSVGECYWLLSAQERETEVYERLSAPGSMVSRGAVAMVPLRRV